MRPSRLPAQRPAICSRAPAEFKRPSISHTDLNHQIQIQRLQTCLQRTPARPPKGQQPTAARGWRGCRILDCEGNRATINSWKHSWRWMAATCEPCPLHPARSGVPGRPRTPVWERARPLPRARARRRSRKPSSTTSNLRSASNRRPG